jgi:hypothetical protein
VCVGLEDELHVFSSESLGRYCFALQCVYVYLFVCVRMNVCMGVGLEDELHVFSTESLGRYCCALQWVYKCLYVCR